MMTIEDFWCNFIKDVNEEDFGFAGELTFESRGFQSDATIALILSGKKRAFFSTYTTYAIDSEALPLSDECYVVTDRSGEPRCIIQLTSVSIVPFNEVTWDMARLEGEDENLESWKEKQWEYLEDEASIVGFQLSENIKLVFQTFRVVYGNSPTVKGKCQS